MQPPIQTAPYLTDPPDVWDKLNPISLGEHAVRTGSISTFDRRGTVFAYDDFENAPLKWITSGHGTATLSTEYPLHGSGCMKFVTPVIVGNYVRAQRNFGGLAKNRIGAEITAYQNTNVTTLTALVMRIYTGSKYIVCGVSIQDDGSGGLKYLNAIDPTLSASWTTFDTSFPIFTQTMYPLKFVIDVETPEYVRCMFCGTEINMSAYTPFSVASTTAQAIVCEAITISDGTGPTTYFDDLILTIEEPA